MEKQNIRIKLRAYDNKVLDASTEEIVNTVKRTGAPVLLTVFTISSVEASRTLLSYALSFILIFCFSIIPLPF